LDDSSDLLSVPARKVGFIERDAVQVINISAIKLRLQTAEIRIIFEIRLNCQIDEFSKNLFENFVALAYEA
jgi:hypothetical protein